MNLKDQLEQIQPSVEPSRWQNHEHVRGYGVFGLPLTSGHILALRVFPINDFAPYVTVWHRDPQGNWSIYVQALRPDIACPRYYGPATRHIAPAQIELIWRGPAELAIRAEPRHREDGSENEGLSRRNRLTGYLPAWLNRAQISIDGRQVSPNLTL